MPRDPRALSVATHNLGDRAKARPLADLIGFTETTPDLLDPIRPDYTVRRSPAGAVALAWRPDLIRPDTPPEWHQAHDGQARLTPARGTWVLDFTHRATGAKGRLLVAHFINGTEKRKPPAAVRQRLWDRHAAQIARLTAQGRRQGRDVILAADTNVRRFDHPALAPLTDLQRRQRTYDHVMHAGDWVPRQATRGASGGSDHRPVIAHLRVDTPDDPEETTMSNLPGNLPQILRDAGLTVRETPGWRTRGRPSGGFAPVGVLCHHTATYKSSSDANVVDLLVRGRPDLPGPLCQLGLARDGTVHLIAAGRGNHAGKARASGTVAAGDGNRLYIGIEAFNDGRGEPWPAKQYDAYARLAAVLCEKVTGNSVATVRGHKETSVTGKIDPTFDMDRFRAAVTVRMKADPKPTRPPRPKPKPVGARKQAARLIIARAKKVKRPKVAKLMNRAARSIRRNRKES